MKVSIQRLEVAVGEPDVEPLHPRPVLELALLDGDTDGDGDPFVQRGEIAQAARCPDRPVDDRRDRVDRPRRASSRTGWVAGPADFSAYGEYRRNELRGNVITTVAAPQPHSSYRCESSPTYATCWVAWASNT